MRYGACAEHLSPSCNYLFHFSQCNYHCAAFIQTYEAPFCLVSSLWYTAGVEPSGGQGWPIWELYVSTITVSITEQSELKKNYAFAFWSISQQLLFPGGALLHVCYQKNKWRCKFLGHPSVTNSSSLSQCPGGRLPLPNNFHYDSKKEKGSITHGTPRSSRNWCANSAHHTDCISLMTVMYSSKPWSSWSSEFWSLPACRHYIFSPSALHVIFFLADASAFIFSFALLTRLFFII